MTEGDSPRGQTRPQLQSRHSSTHSDVNGKSAKTDGSSVILNRLLVKDGGQLAVLWEVHSVLGDTRPEDGKESGWF